MELSFKEQANIIRKRKKITQKEMADKMGVIQQNVAQFFNTDKDMKLSTMYKIADALDCDLKIELVPRK